MTYTINPAAFARELISKVRQVDDQHRLDNVEASGFCRCGLQSVSSCPCSEIIKLLEKPPEHCLVPPADPLPKSSPN